MARLHFRRPSPAMVVALIALFVALGGVGYAASQLPKNSVGTKQLKKNAVTSAKVKDHSLLAGDFKAGQLPAGPKGEAGPAGAQGPKGETGPRGPGATTLVYDATASATPTPTSVGTVLGDTFTAECEIAGPDEARLTVYLQTSDGSLRWDYGTQQTDNGTDSARPGASTNRRGRSTRRPKSSKCWPNRGSSRTTTPRSSSSIPSAAI